MSIRLIAILGGTAFLFVSSASVKAMDPFTVIAVGSTALDTAQSVAGASQEAAATAESLSALAELTGEIQDDPALDEDATDITKRLQEVQSMALEAGYTHDEVDELLNGSRNSSQTFTGQVRSLAKSVRLAKRLAALAGISSLKAAQVSEVEQVKSRNDEKKILTSIYRQIVVSGLDKKRDEIKKERDVKKEVGKLNKFLGALAPGGDLRLFPAQKAIVQKAIAVFRSYSGYLLALVGLIFVGRILYYEFSFAASDKYSELVFNTFTCFFLMVVFPMLYGYMAEYSDMLATQIAKSLHVAGATQPEPGHLFGHVMPWWLQPAVIQLVIYFLVYSVFNLVLAVLIAIGPIVILTGTMLHFTISLPAYFAALVLVWLWPVVWNAVGYFASLLWQGKDWTGSGIAETLAALLLWLFQLLTPLALYNHLKQTQVGKALHGVVKHLSESKSGQAGKTGGQLLAAKATGGTSVLAAGASQLFTARSAKSSDNKGVLLGSARFTT